MGANIVEFTVCHTFCYLKTSEQDWSVVTCDEERSHLNTVCTQSHAHHKTKEKKPKTSIM